MIELVICAVLIAAIAIAYAFESNRNKQNEDAEAKIAAVKKYIAESENRQKKMREWME